MSLKLAWSTGQVPRQIQIGLHRETLPQGGGWGPDSEVGMVVRACNPSSREAEAGLRGGGPPGLHSAKPAWAT